MAVVVISGGSEGLGRALVATLSREHTVVALARHADSLRDCAASYSCRGLVCDVTQPVQISQTIETVLAEFGRIDVLINNAGLLIHGDLETCTPEQINQVIQVNVLGVMYLTRTIVPIMKQQGHGHILTVGSQAGLNAKAGRSVYNASKWAITGFGRSLQKELAPHNIAVTTLFPGVMNTALLAKASQPLERSRALEPTQVAEWVAFLLRQPAPLVVTEISLLHQADLD